NKYNLEFKLKVLEEIKKDSYNQIGIKYGLSYSVIAKWERIYLEEGIEGLSKERRGRTTKEESPNKGRAKRLSEKIEKDLIDEIQWLRMENEYLKKYNALVQEKEKLERKKKLK
ncbi:MAG: transposase, partial [Fusobacteriaceae bacterium]